MITMLCSVRRASSSDCRATATGSPTPLPGSGAYTGTPACRPITCNWSTAFGRCRSAATSSGVLPCSLSHSASLPASVVLPEPCRPASMITVGGTLANRSRLASPPRISTSSSCTILMTCCAGLSACDTSAPLARSFTRAMNCLHHGQRDVRLEQGDANLARGRVDVGGRQPPLAAQLGEDLGQPVGERLKHASRLPGPGGMGDGQGWRAVPCGSSPAMQGRRTLTRKSKPGTF